MFYTVNENAYALKTAHLVALPFIYGVACIIISHKIYIYYGDDCQCLLSQWPRMQSYPAAWITAFPMVNGQQCMPKEDIVGLGDLDLWPMTLPFELGLDMFRHDLHVKIQVCMYSCFTRIVRLNATLTQGVMSVLINWMCVLINWNPVYGDFDIKFSELIWKDFQAFVSYLTRVVQSCMTRVLQCR